MFQGLTFKCAGDDDLPQAIELRRQVYEDDVGVALEDDLDGRAFHLIARTDAGEVIAALRILGPDFRPFEIEQSLPLDDFLPSNRVPALIGRFCVRPDYRSVSKHILLPIGMLKLTYEFSRKQGFTDLLLYTFPHLINFYRGGFFRLTDVTFHHVGYDCQMHIMHLDLVALGERWSGATTPVARFLLGAHPPNFRV